MKERSFGGCYTNYNNEEREVEVCMVQNVRGGGGHFLSEIEEAFVGNTVLIFGGSVTIK